MSEDKIKVIHELKIIPSGEFILVSVDDDNNEEKTSGGLIVPRGALQNKKTMTGTIVAVGDGRRDPTDYNKRIPMDCKAGDKVLCAVFIGYPVMIPDADGRPSEHVIIKHGDVMAFVEEKSEWIDADSVARTDAQRSVL